MADNDGDKARIIELGHRFFVRQEVDNIAWMVVDDAVLVVDALEQADLAEEVLRLIDETTGGLVVRWVLNTHTHYDHIVLNAVFRQQFGAQIINAQNTDISAAGLSFGESGRTVRMFSQPDCHTAEDCIVWVPGDSVLLVGDIFGWGLIPWDQPLDHEKLEFIIKTYEKLIDFGAETVVPGHGPLCTTADLQRWVQYIREAVATTKAALADGKTRREIRAEEIPAPADMAHWWRFLDWKHEDTIKKITQAAVRGKL